MLSSWKVIPRESELELLELGGVGGALEALTHVGGVAVGQADHKFCMPQVPDAEGC
jgi:hypothetical protein